jgi:tetratricopeptide (TPR) repeat protein
VPKFVRKWGAVKSQSSGITQLPGGAKTELLDCVESGLSMLNLPKKIACLIAGAGCLMLVNGGAALANDVDNCLNTEGQIEALERIGACSRAIEGGLSGDQLVKARVHRGLGYGQIGQMDQAIADFSEALKTDKTNVPVWIARSRAYFHKQQHDLAMLDLAEAIKQAPDNAVAQNLMGKNHFMLGNYELAIKFFDKAIDLDSNFYNAFVNRATTYYRDNQLQKAMQDVNAAYLMLPPNDSRGRGLLQLKVAIERAYASQQRANTNQQTN